jgi:hypothetical protein
MGRSAGKITGGAGNDGGGDNDSNFRAGRLAEFLIYLRFEKTYL